MDHIESLIRSDRLLPQDTGSLCPDSFRVEISLRLQSAATVWPLRLFIAATRRNPCKDGAAGFISATQPDQSLQSLQLPKLLPLEWLKKDSKPSISASA